MPIEPIQPIHQIWNPMQAAGIAVGLAGQQQSLAIHEQQMGMQLRHQLVQEQLESAKAIAGNNDIPAAAKFNAVNQLFDMAKLPKLTVEEYLGSPDKLAELANLVKEGPTKQAFDYLMTLKSDPSMPPTLVNRAQDIYNHVEDFKLQQSGGAAAQAAGLPTEMGPGLAKHPGAFTEATRLAGRQAELRGLSQQLGISMDRAAALAASPKALEEALTKGGEMYAAKLEELHSKSANLTANAQYLTDQKGLVADRQAYIQEQVRKLKLDETRTDLQNQLLTVDKEARAQFQSDIPRLRQEAGSQLVQYRSEVEKLKTQLESAPADQRALIQDAITNRETLIAAREAEDNFLQSPTSQMFQAWQTSERGITTRLRSMRTQNDELNIQKVDILKSKLTLEQSKAQDLRDIASAQLMYVKGGATEKSLIAAAEEFPHVTPEKIREAMKLPNQPPVQINMGKGLGEKVSDIVMESRNMALGAGDTVDAVQRARTAINKELVNVGPTATIRQKIGQVSQVLGIGGQDNAERLVNTRNVMRALAQFSLGARKQLKGQGQVSDFEGKLIVKAESGEIEDMTIPELKSFLDVTERLARKGYGLHQQNLARMRANPELKEAVPFYEVPELPAPTSSIGPYSDPAKERRYQEYLKKQGQ